MNRSGMRPAGLERRIIYICNQNNNNIKCRGTRPRPAVLCTYPRRWGRGGGKDEDIIPGIVFLVVFGWFFSRCKFMAWGAIGMRLWHVYIYISDTCRSRASNTSLYIIIYILYNIITNHYWIAHGQLYIMHSIGIL